MTLSQLLAIFATNGQWFVLLWPKLHSPNVLHTANDDDIRVMMIATSRVTLIVPACQPGWEKMENLRGNLRKFGRK